MSTGTQILTGLGTWWIGSTALAFLIGWLISRTRPPRQ
jgi:hypothetical protein